MRFCRCWARAEQCDAVRKRSSTATPAPVHAPCVWLSSTGFGRRAAAGLRVSALAARFAGQCGFVSRGWSLMVSRESSTSRRPRVDARAEGHPRDVGGAVREADLHTTRERQSVRFSNRTQPRCVRPCHSGVLHIASAEVLELPASPRPPRCAGVTERESAQWHSGCTRRTRQPNASVRTVLGTGGTR